MQLCDAHIMGMGESFAFVKDKYWVSWLIHPSGKFQLFPMRWSGAVDDIEVTCTLKPTKVGIHALHGGSPPIKCTESTQLWHVFNLEIQSWQNIFIHCVFKELLSMSFWYKTWGLPESERKKKWFYEMAWLIAFHDPARRMIMSEIIASLKVHAPQSNFLTTTAVLLFEALYKTSTFLFSN